MKLRLLSLLAATACLPALGQSAQPSKYALLIGIGTYEHAPDEIQKPAPGTPQVGRYDPAIAYTNLKGPANDVRDMRSLLASKRFYFPDANIFVLAEDKATHDGILKAMQKFLVDDRRAGDTAVLYISSHGSLRVYPKGQGPADGQLYDMFGDPTDLRHVENTIVPYDWYTGADDIFSRDFRHIFFAAARKGVNITAIFDSCHSGSLSRGLGESKFVTRDLSFDPRPMPPDPYAKEAAGTLPQNLSTNPVLILSAAQKDQSAIDDQSADPAHGLFTRALIQTLMVLPEDRSADDVFKRLQIAMELAPGSVRPQPELDSTRERRAQPLFGGVAGNGPAVAAVVSVDDSGVVLDIGTAADIGPGSTFAAVGPDKVTLQVVHSDLARSTAKITSAGKNIHPTDIVQLVRAVPWERPSLLFYVGAANPPAADIQDAFAAVRAAGLTLVADPSSDPWTEHLLWENAHWALHTHSKAIAPGRTQPEQVVVLGAKLTASELKKVPAGSKVWFDPPLPKETAQTLLVPDPNGTQLAAKLTPDRAKAKYIIGARPSGSDLQYAWFKRDDVDGEVLTPKGSGAGCSPNSAYPLRTDYTAGRLETALTGSATQLARLNGWYSLQSSGLTDHENFPYGLSLRRVTDNKDLASVKVDSPYAPQQVSSEYAGNQLFVTHKGGYEMALVAAQPPKNPTPRWVYVIGVDCQGKGTVLWPYEGMPPGKFPADTQGREMRIPLPGLPFPIDDPLGTDTYLLLTTSTPLSDYNALNFSGVVTRGLDARRGALSPLEELLDDVSAGVSTRGGGPVPTDWSVQVLQTQSQPDPDGASAAADDTNDKIATPAESAAAVTRGVDPSDTDEKAELARLKAELAASKAENAALKAEQASARGPKARQVEQEQAPRTGRYYAIVIGIDDYATITPKLKTARADALAVKQVLEEKYGFTKVYLILDGEATKAGIIKTLDALRDSLTKEDSLLIYYAGHGYFEDEVQIAYWLPVDATMDGPAREQSWIESRLLSTEFIRQKAGHVLVISDSCYSGAMTREVQGAPPSIEDNEILGRALEKKSRDLMASGGKEPVSDAGSEGHSIFAYKLLQALDDPRQPQMFTATHLFYSSIRERVGGNAHHQVPEYWPLQESGHDGGDFVFVRQAKASP